MDSIKDTNRGYLKNKYILFTLLYIGSLITIALTFYQAGKTFVWLDDAISQYIVDFQSVKNLFINGQAAYSNYGLTENNAIFRFFYWGIRTLPAVLLSEKSYVGFLIFLFVIQSYLAGIFFMKYCSYMEVPEIGQITGALAYVFTGYLTYSILQPEYEHTLTFLPLLFLGIECILEHKKGIFLSCMVALAALCCVTYIWPITCVLAIYIVIVLFQRSKNVEKKSIFFLFELLHIIAYWFLGILASGVFFIPMAMGIRNSYRMEPAISSPSIWHYDKSDYIPLLEGLFGPNASRLGTRVSLSVVLLAAVVLLLSKRKNAGQKSALAMFVLSFILYLIPLWGLVTKGFANVSNYWYFGMIFFAAYVVANASEDILSLEIRANKIFYVTYALLTLVYFVFRYIYRNNIQYKYSSLWIVLMLVFAFILPYIKNSGLKSMCLIAFLVVNVAVNTNFSVKNRLPSYMDKGISLAEYYADFPDNAALEILDDSFYRVDKDNYMGEYNLNLPQWYGYNGMSVFHSVIQKQPYRYYTQTENRGLIVNNKISDLDSRAMAELLADTKYFLSPADNDSLVPYGYELYKESAGEKGNINIYRNKYNPALGYTYPSDIYVSEEEASKLSGIEKQELMMQAPIIDSESTGAGIADSYDFTSQELSYQIKELTDVTIDGDSISVKTNSGFITMEINHPADSEVYIRLGGLTPGEGNYFFKVICNGAVKEVYQYNKGEFHKVNRDEVLINLGYQEEAGQIECTVGFSKGMYSLDNLQVFGQSMRNMDAYAGRLLNETFTVEEMNSRRIEGTIDASCDKWLCFSLPYSGGWDLTVDEEKASVQCLNYMYLGTLIEKGQHHILLEYHIPGFRYGVMCSIVGTGLMICMGWRERNAKRKDQQLL